MVKALNAAAGRSWTIPLSLLQLKPLFSSLFTRPPGRTASFEPRSKKGDPDHVIELGA